MLCIDIVQINHMKATILGGIYDLRINISVLITRPVFIFPYRPRARKNNQENWYTVLVGNRLNCSKCSEDALPLLAMLCVQIQTVVPITKNHYFPMVLCPRDQSEDMPTLPPRRFLIVPVERLYRISFGIIADVTYYDQPRVPTRSFVFWFLSRICG